MKKITLIISALFLAMGVSFGQGMKEATETAQSANEALQAGQYEVALAGFQSALKTAEGLGAEGSELVGQCKGIIPQITLAMAKKKGQNGDIEGAVKGCEDAIDIATKYGNESVIKEATELIPDLYVSKGIEYLKAENATDAITEFNKALALKDEGSIHFYLAQALSKSGDNNAAIEAFNKAAEMGYQAETCKKQISTIKLKEALAAYKGGKLADAVEKASALISENAGNASIKNSAAGIIVGCTQTAASRNPAEGVNYYNKLAAIDPSNPKLGYLAYVIGANYYKQKNTAQAKTWLTKASTDATVGAKAKQILAVIK